MGKNLKIIEFSNFNSLAAQDAKIRNITVRSQQSS
jgi:hypothetical protein